MTITPAFGSIVALAAVVNDPSSLLGELSPRRTRPRSCKIDPYPNPCVDCASTTQAMYTTRRSSYSRRSARLSDFPMIASPAGEINGFPALSFDGADDVLVTPAFSLGTYTILMVCTGQTGAAAGWFWTRTTAGAVVDTLYGTINSTIYSQRGANISDYNLTTGWGQWVPADARVLTTVMDGTHAGHKLRLNGVEQSLMSGTANNPGSGTTNDHFTIAARDDSVLPSATKVAEVAIFNRALTADELLTIEQYSRRRYALY